MGSLPPKTDVICLPSTKHCIPKSIFLSHPHQSLIGLTDSWNSRQNFDLNTIQNLGLVLLRVGDDPANPPRAEPYQVPGDLLTQELQAGEEVVREEVSSIIKLPSSEGSGTSQGHSEEEEEKGSGQAGERERHLDSLAGRLFSGTIRTTPSTTTRASGRKYRMSSSSSSSSSSDRAVHQQDECIQTDLACREYHDFYYQPVSQAARDAMAEDDKVSLLSDPCDRHDEFCNTWGSFREETLVPFKQSLEAVGGFGNFQSDDVKGNPFSTRGWNFFHQAMSILPDLSKMGIYSAVHVILKLMFMILGEVRLNRIEDSDNAQVNTTMGAVTAAVQALFVMLYGYIGKKWIAGILEDRRDKKEKKKNARLYKDLKNISIQRNQARKGRKVGRPKRARRPSTPESELIEMLPQRR